MNRLSQRSARRALMAVGLVSVALLSGCATYGNGAATAQNAEQQVTQRAQERWNHLLKLEFAKAYAYLSPAERALTSEESYVQRFGRGASWVSAKASAATCDSAERCSVVINLETQVVARGFKDPIKTTPTEIWIFENGQWWFHKNP